MRTIMNDDAAAAEQLVNAFERGQLSRRQLVARLMAIGAASAGFASLARAAEPATQPATFAAATIDHLALSVTDVKRSVAFYQKHLGLKLTRDGGDGSAFLNCGERDFLALFRGEKPGLHHFSFSIPNYNADDAARRIEAAGLKLRREGNRVYFRDPDDLEVQVHT
jgi:catechol 2,3-dioxygenase-like lactoylglutathione lyase family enzyme